MIPEVLGVGLRDNFLGIGVRFGEDLGLDLGVAFLADNFTAGLALLLLTGDDSLIVPRLGALTELFRDDLINFSALGTGVLTGEDFLFADFGVLLVAFFPLEGLTIFTLQED